MAVSADGFIAKGATDDMKWLGPHDKTAFKLLTLAGNGACGVSEKSARLMPPYLEGRTIHKISREQLPLEFFAKRYGPDCSLLGGQTLALAALRQELVTSVHICRSYRMAFPSKMTKRPDDAIEDYITQGLICNGSWHLVTEVRVGDTIVETWRE